MATHPFPRGISQAFTLDASESRGDEMRQSYGFPAATFALRDVLTVVARGAAAFIGRGVGPSVGGDVFAATVHFRQLAGNRLFNVRHGKAASWRPWPGKAAVTAEVHVVVCLGRDRYFLWS